MAYETKRDVEQVLVVGKGETRCSLEIDVEPRVHCDFTRKWSVGASFIGDIRRGYGRLLTRRREK